MYTLFLDSSSHIFRTFVVKPNGSSVMISKTITDKTVRFKSSPNKDQFVKILKNNLDDYFKKNKTTPYANAEYWIKVIVAFGSWFGIYALIMSDVLSTYPLLLLMAFSLLGFVNILIAFTAAHDGIHDAVSPKPWVNRVLSRGMDFIGGNSYLLRQMHGEHHKWVNIHGIDVTLETHGLFRFTPHEPWKPIHRFQHYYIPVLYSLAQIHWALFKDFKWFFSENHIGNKKNVTHPLKEYLVLFFFKGLYMTLTLVLPLLFLSAPWWLVVIGWIAIHILSGLYFALVFQCTHIYDGTTYPMPDDEGNIENNYAIHVLETTADFSRESTIGTWLMAGINIHIVHHIFPHICHVHYRAITPILKKTAEEFGLEYKENKTFFEAMKKHMGMLKQLSNPDSKVPEYSEKNVKSLLTHSA